MSILSKIIIAAELRWILEDHGGVRKYPGPILLITSQQTLHNSQYFQGHQENPSFYWDNQDDKVEKLPTQEAGDQSEQLDDSDEENESEQTGVYSYHAKIINPQRKKEFDVRMWPKCLKVQRL